MLKVLLLRNGISFICNKPFLNFARSAHVIADGRGRCFEHVNSLLKLNFENSESEIPFENLSRSSVTKYTFPKICLKYSAEDCAQHAVSVGLKEWHPVAEKLLKRPSDLQLLPSFPIVFCTEILIGLAATFQMDSAIHTEQFINILQPLKPEGNIVVTMKIVDIIDRKFGTLYVFHFYCSDEDGHDLCFLENKVYELGVNGIGAKKSTGEKIKMPDRVADHVFEFQTVPFSPTFHTPSSDDMKESIFSPNNRDQYYGIIDKLSSEPHCHGQYVLGVVIQKLLGHFANGDVKFFRSVKTKFSAVVYPGNTLVTKSWKIEERIYFQTLSKETGKIVLSESYLDLNANKNIKQ